MNPTINIPTMHPTKGLAGHRSAKMSWTVLLLQDPETLQTYEEYARESFYEAEGGQPPPLPTPLSACTNTKKPRLLARGEPHIRTVAKRGPLQRPPAWTLTRTPRSREHLRTHPPTTATHPPRPEAKPKRTPPGESIRRSFSPPSTRSLKKRTTPTSTPINSPRRPRPPGTQRWRLLRQWQRPKIEHRQHHQLLRRHPTQLKQRL
jgi:hypothetical protein